MHCLGMLWVRFLLLLSHQQWQFTEITARRHHAVTKISFRYFGPCRELGRKGSFLSTVLI